MKMFLKKAWSMFVSPVVWWADLMKFLWENDILLVTLVVVLWTALVLGVVKIGLMMIGS